MYNTHNFLHHNGNHKDNTDVVRPNHTFNDLYRENGNDNDNDNDIDDDGTLSNGNQEHKYDKYDIYIYDKTDTHRDLDEDITDNEEDQDQQLSINDIINDLQRRKEYRLRHQMHRNRNGSSASSSISSSINSPPRPSLYLSPSPPIHNNINKKYSRFMFATRAIHHQYNKDEEIDKYKAIINEKDNELKSLRQQLSEKEESIKSLQYKLMHHVSADKADNLSIYGMSTDDEDSNDDQDNNSLHPPKLGRHHRQKSVTQTVK